MQANPEFQSLSAFKGEDPHCYAARIRPNHEKRVAERMFNRGIGHLLPLYISLRQWKDRKVCLSMPLFPGYLFVRFCLRERLGVLEVPGLAGLVGIGCQPIPLADAEIQVLQSGKKFEAIIAPRPYLSVGNLALVRNGPFQGLEGIVIGLKNHTRLVICLNLIHSSVTLELDQAELEPVR